MKTPIIDVKEQRIGYKKMVANAREIPSTTFSYASWVSSYFPWGLGGGGVGWMVNSNAVANAGWNCCKELEHFEYIRCLVMQVVVMYLEC